MSSLSLTSYTHYLSTDQEIISQTNTILNKTGCASGNGAAELACLRAYNASGLLTLGTTASQVVVDGKYITSNESSFNGTGHVNRVPLLIGNMRDDGAPFFTYQGSTNLTAVVAGAGIPVAPVLTSGTFPVPNSGNTSLDVYNVTAEAVTDDWFRCEDYATAYAAVTTNTLPEVYYYECKFATTQPCSALFLPLANTTQPPQSQPQLLNPLLATGPRQISLQRADNTHPSRRRPQRRIFQMPLRRTHDRLLLLAPLGSARPRRLRHALRPVHC